MTAPAPQRLAEVLRADGGLVAGAVADPGPGVEGTLAVPGGEVEADLALGVEAIREGYLLHYGSPRVVAPGEDRDLALLVGDRLYALGLERLAALGDLHAIATLAEVIAAGARAHAAGDPEEAAVAWAAGASAVLRQVGDP